MRSKYKYCVFVYSALDDRTHRFVSNNKKAMLSLILAYKHEIIRWSEIYTDENNKTEIRSAQSIKDFFKTL